MGNRAVITTRKGWLNKETNLGVYLHWNGGKDSVEAFLAYCKLKGYRPPESDNYGWARLCQVIGNFFGGEASVGIDTVSRLDYENFDNGTYIIEDWEIVGRKHYNRKEQNKYPLQEMLEAIDKTMPRKEQLRDYLKAKEVSTSSLMVGDEVFIRELSGEMVLYEVVGFGEDKVVNGHDVLGVPFVARYGDDGDYSNNPNNYIFTSTVKLYVD